MTLCSGLKVVHIPFHSWVVTANQTVIAIDRPDVPRNLDKRATPFGRIFKPVAKAHIFGGDGRDATVVPLR